MKLSDISVRRPVFAAVVAMLIAVIGIVGFFGLSVREYPDVDPPVVSVETQYVGAAASVVESRVTQVLEEQLSGLEGLQTITSRSRDGQSSITIETSPRLGLSVPELAVIGEGESRFVYTVDQSGTARRTAVRTGLRSAGRVEILEGLKPGQKVVTEGVVKLTDGMKVRLAGAGNAEPGPRTKGQGGQAQGRAP